MAETGGTRVIRTVCGIEDGSSCGILAHVREGRVVKVEPADMPEPWMRHICCKGLCTVKMAYHPDRLKYPLKRAGERGEGKWERITWDEAFETMADRFREIGEKYGKDAVAMAVGQTISFWLTGIYTRLASAIGATQIGIVGYGDSAGPGADMLCFGNAGWPFQDSFEDPGMVVLWGGNFSVTFSLRWRDIQRKKEKGARLVVIDPIYGTSASKAHEYIGIRPGTDAALALGMMKVILDRGLEDRPFMTQHTVAPFLVRSDNGLFLREKDVRPDGSDRYMVWDTKSEALRPSDGEGVVPALEGAFTAGGTTCRPAFDLLVEVIGHYPLGKASDITGIPPETIENLAVAYVTAKPVATYRGLGMQRTFHGDLAFRAVTTLAALTGNMNLEHPPRSLMMQAENFIMVDGRPFNYMPVLHMYKAIEKGEPRPIKGLYIGATNFVNQNANANKIINELFPRLDFIVVHDLFMTASAEYADLVLPACTFFEYTDVLPSVFSVEPFVQLQQKVIEPLYEAKCPLDVVKGIAGKMGVGDHFNRTAEEYIALILSSGHPSLEGITLEKLKKGPVLSQPYDMPLFSTPSGRIEFYSESMKPFGQELPIFKEPLESDRTPLAEKYPLTLVQSHMKYVKNSMLVNEPWMRELNPEPVLEMHPVDAEKRGIRDGDMVVAFNDRGRAKLKAIIHQGVRPGSVDLHQGWWPRDYVEGSHQALTQCELNPAQDAAWEPNMAVFDNLVEVRKEGE